MTCSRGTLPWREPDPNRVADDGVSEPPQSGLVGRCEQRRTLCVGEQGERLDRLPLDDRREVRNRYVPGQHRGRPNDVPSCWRQLSHPFGDRGSDRQRDNLLARAAWVRCEGAAHLADEKRVTAGAGQDVLHRGRIDHKPVDCGQLAAYPGGVEPVHIETGCDVLPEQRGEHVVFFTLRPVGCSPAA